MRNRFGSFTLFLILAVALIAPAVAHGQPAGLGLAAAGPTATGPLGLFPAWYMDTNGVGLELCEGVNCLSAVGDLGNPAVGESFYYSMDAPLRSGLSTGFVALELEAAFLQAPFNANNAMVFNRLRVRMFALPAAGNYTVTHPYGSRVIAAIPDPANPGLFKLNETVDLPGTAGPNSFSQVLRARNMGPFLKTANAPAGFLGNANGAPSLLVAPGPNGDAVTITGPGFVATTRRFAIGGKLATNGGLSSVSSFYSRNAAGAGTLDLHAHSIGGQRIVGIIGTAPNTRTVRLPKVVHVPGQVGHYEIGSNFLSGQDFQPVTIRNLTDAGRPSVTFDTVPDLVTITQATFAAGTLTIRANTSDEFAPRPLLIVFDAAGNEITRRRGTINFTAPSAFSPGNIRVTSSAGGSARAAVQ